MRLRSPTPARPHSSSPPSCRPAAQSKAQRIGCVQSFSIWQCVECVRSARVGNPVKFQFSYELISKLPVLRVQAGVAELGGDAAVVRVPRVQAHARFAVLDEAAVAHLPALALALVARVHYHNRSLGEGDQRQAEIVVPYLAGLCDRPLLVAAGVVALIDSCAGAITSYYHDS